MREIWHCSFNLMTVSRFRVDPTEIYDFKWNPRIVRIFMRSYCAHSFIKYKVDLCAWACLFTLFASTKGLRSKRQVMKELLPFGYFWVLNALPTLETLVKRKIEFHTYNITFFKLWINSACSSGFVLCIWYLVGVRRWRHKLFACFRTLNIWRTRRFIEKLKTRISFMLLSRGLHFLHTLYIFQQSWHLKG